MSVAIQSDDTESLRDQVEADYRAEDVDVPDEHEAGYPSVSMYSFEHCC